MKSPERNAYTIIGQPREGWERVGALILHGFMGSPASTNPMAHYLAAQGITVHCPLLPGHGNLPYQIHGYGREQWLAEVEEAYQFLAQSAIRSSCSATPWARRSRRISATTFDKVSGLVLMAPLYDVPDNRIKIAAVGRYFLTWLYPLKFSVVDHEIFVGRVLDYDPTVNVDDPEMQEWLVEATRISVSAIDEMRKMAVLGRKLWPRIHQPAIVFQGGRDPAVDISLTETLFQKLPTADKEMKLFPQAGHELMRPVEPIHDKVWQKTFEFIEEHAEIGPKVPTAFNAPSLLVPKKASRTLRSTLPARPHNHAIPT